MYQAVNNLGAHGLELDLDNEEDFEIMEEERLKLIGQIIKLNQDLIYEQK